MQTKEDSLRRMTQEENDFKFLGLSGQGKVIIWIQQRTQKDPPYPKIGLLIAFTRNLHSARNCAKTIMVYLILTQILVMKYFSFPREGNDLSLEGTRMGMTPEHSKRKVKTAAVSCLSPR